MPVRTRIIHRPIPGKTRAVVGAIRIACDIGVAEPRAGPFAFLLIVVGQREILVFDRRPFLERLLRSEHAPGSQSQKSHGKSCADAHQASSVFRVSDSASANALDLVPSARSLFSKARHKAFALDGA